MLVFICIAYTYATMVFHLIGGACCPAIPRILIGHMSATYDWLLMYTIWTMAYTFEYI